MNYYNQGDAANAERIKVAFEKLGYKTIEYCFNAERTLYFTFGGAIKTATYEPYKSIIKTHPDYKELELPVEPKFKVGDSLQSGSMWAMVRRIDTENQRYICQFDNVIPFEEQDRWNFVPNPKKHYAIANFYAGMPVLQRSSNDEDWDYNIFSRYIDDNRSHPFILVGCHSRQCIPYNEDTKHLLGTTDMPSEEYINW